MSPSSAYVSVITVTTPASPSLSSSSPAVWVQRSVPSLVTVLAMSALSTSASAPCACVCMCMRACACA
eukprot:4147861-Lingulodinium_polyedra.AAC.1